MKLCIYVVTCCGTIPARVAIEMVYTLDFGTILWCSFGCPARFVALYQFGAAICPTVALVTCCPRATPSVGHICRSISIVEVIALVHVWTWVGVDGDDCGPVWLSKIKRKSNRLDYFVFDSKMCVDCRENTNRSLGFIDSMLSIVLFSSGLKLA